MIPKLLTFTRNRAQLESMAPWIRYIYYRGLADGMSIIATQDEFDSHASTFIHRFLEEFSLEEPLRQDLDWLLAAARRALREELPAWILLPDDPAIQQPLRELAGELGIRSLTLCRQGLVLDQGAIVVRPEELEDSLPAALVPAPIRLPTDPEEWLRHLAPVLRARFPVAAEEPGPGIQWGEMSLGLLARSLDPEATLREILLRRQRGQLVEPVNLPLGGATFCYGDYDSEAARPPATHDLRRLLAQALAPGTWRAEVLEPRGEYASFLITLGESAPPWLDRFPLSGRSHRILVVDSQSVAGSVFNHCTAINRFTAWRATALVAEKHPFIDYPAQDCPFHSASDGLTPQLRRELEAAEVFLFFEDDDENSPSWPFDLRPFVEGKPVLHLYIGHRVHKNVVAGQRPDRTILTPLPHLCRMFPQAHFYAGFPPATLDDMPIRPPRSEKDGIVRVLHTPSLPHHTTHRYYYHKDTEAYLEAAQLLRPRHPHSQFWQLGGLSHDKILQARQDCDITFNQLRGYHGLSGDEAMYLERPMVQAFDRHNINRHREYWGLDVDFPWVDAKPGELTSVLEGLLEDPGRRRDIGVRSREFMLEYFSPQKGIVPLVYHCEKALQ